ncbi:hypothetical protein BDN71DRAFT_666025 [Pleurotus eryngii]|uniref:Uncharacterized protein n=1 Tax=Pleurotus eryngii TaxID=5323 RepID=A0A9P6A0K0_PLEER|nr:hypothetical protein BDN71DRAFT_666025 [Pleurotus eryngii]
MVSPHKYHHLVLSLIIPPSVCYPSESLPLFFLISTKRQISEEGSRSHHSHFFPPSLPSPAFQIQTLSSSFSEHQEPCTQGESHYHLTPVPDYTSPISHCPLPWHPHPGPEQFHHPPPPHSK